MPLEFSTFIDANQMNSTTLDNLIVNTWKPGNHTLVIATNGGINQLNANLTVCGNRGVGYIGNDFNRINTYLYNTTTWQPLTDAGTQAEADTLVQAIVNDVGNKPALRAWYLADEPRGTSNARLQKLVIAFKKFSSVPVTAMLIGLNADRGGVQATLLPLDQIMMDIYSIGRTAAPMNFAMTPFGLGTETFQTYTRKFLTNASYSPTKPLHMLLQAHDVLIDGNPNVYSTRLPSVAETYAQMFFGVGEGADSIGFFTWQARTPEANGNNGWTGLENMPTQWAAMKDFAARVQPFRDLLSDTSRAATQAFDAGAAYCSTLETAGGARKFAVVCNATNSTGDFAITGTGAQASGFLRNLETDQIIAVGSTVNLDPGEGRFYEWTASASGTPTGHNGVPTLTIGDYSQGVESWWDAHPFNPESSAYNPTINIPAGALEIDVNAAPHNGSLWSAVQAAQAAVGLDGHAVIWLGTGTYDGSTVFPDGTPGRYKNNLQLRAKSGATPVIVNRLRLIPFNDARDYDWWSDAQQHNWVTTVVDPNNASRMLPAREAIAYLVRGWYFKGITFDGGGTNIDNLYMSSARDVVIDDCVFQGIVHPGGTVHPAHVDGNAMLKNIWMRNCTFRGRQPYTSGTLPWQAVYLDGLHGGGTINCTFQNSFSSHTEVLYLANNDFLRDYNRNNTADVSEWPMAQYVISYNCLSQTTFKHFDCTGRNCMVDRLTKTGGGYGWSMAWFDSKEDTVVNTEFPKVQYVYGGHVVKRSDVSAITASGYLVRVNAKLPGAATPTPPPELIGNVTVKNNIVRVAGWSRWLSQEGEPTQHIGGYVVSGNADSGTIPPPTSGGGGTPGAGVPTSLVFATQPANGTAGQSFGTVVVEVRDVTGARATAYNDPVVLSLAVNPAGATLSGQTTVNAVNGLATFTGLTVSDAGVGYRLRAVSSVDVSAQSAAFDMALAGAVGAYRPGTISHVATASVASPTTLNNATIARPVGVLDTDLAVLVLYREAQADPTSVPTGFTLAGAANFGASFRAWVYTGLAGALTSYVVQWAAAAWRQASISFYRGQDAAQGVDVVGVFGTDDTNGTAVTAPGLTTVTDYAVVVGAWAIRSGGTIWTPPSGYTARTPVQAHVHIATAEQHPPGATGSQTATVNLNGPRAGLLLAIRPAASSTPPPQYARPASDGSAGGWTAVPSGGSLASKIDEAVLDDTDYIESPVGPNASSTFRIKLGSVNPPGSTSGHRLSVRMRKSAAAGQQVDVVLRLVQGASTLIRSWTVTNLTDVMTTYTLGDLTTAEAASITNYADLYLEGYAVGAGS